MKIIINHPAYIKNIIGKQTDEESLLSDHGVRKYDKVLGQFTCPDPLWEKYYSWTPYQYAGCNPVSMLDGNGETIEIQYTDSKNNQQNFIYDPDIEYNLEEIDSKYGSFVRNAIKAFNYLKKDKKGRNNKKVLSGLKKLADPTIGSVLIKEGNWDDSNYGNCEIIWGANSGFIVDDGQSLTNKQPPALGLWHELGHAYQELIGMPIEEMKGWGDSNYGNTLEKDNIESWENPVARDLGIPVRNHHFGEFYPTIGPTSIQEVR